MLRLWNIAPLVAGVIFILVTIADARIHHIKKTTKYEAPPHIHSKFAYVTWTKEKGYDIKIFAAHLTQPSGLDWVAKARYQNFVNKTGWAFVEVESKPTWPDDMQAYAAGMAEGYLTKDLIYDFWRNMIEHACDDKPQVCKYVKKYVAQNVDWTTVHAKKYKAASPYWHQVNLLIQQFEGLYSGFQKAANNTIASKLTWEDLLSINIIEDTGDLNEALDPNPSRDPTDKAGHCSVLIKLIGNRDIYASHVTWTTYQSMLRIIKRYNLAYKTSDAAGSPTVPSAEISFSSYPGMLHSMDDWYILSSGLLVTETTIENYNKDLWPKIKPTNSIFAGLRAMIANRLATDGQSWTAFFSRYNSGTYNNQWMIVNYNLFEPTKPINKGLLWILEQLPGKTQAKDVTDVLQKQGYWASYNTPYFTDIFEASGSPKMVEKYGDFYSYENAPRAKIFARDQGKVEDIDTMMKLMRYNDFQHDPLSRCNCTPPYSAENAISSRNDLNPVNGTYPIKLLGHRSSGSTDMKLVNLDLFLLQRFIAWAGPTYDDLPPFQWSKTDFLSLPHYGMPDKFEFEPLIHKWKWL